MGWFNIEPSAVSVQNGPETRLDIVPEKIVPSGLPPSRRRRLVALGFACLAHVGFAALAVVLLQWRDLTILPERAIPVEIVLHAPDMQDAPPAGPPPRLPDTTQPAPAKPAAQAVDGQAPPLSGDAPKPQPPPPMLVAPPPEAARATAQPKTPQQANLEPEKPASPPPKAAPPPAEAPAVLNSASGTFSVAPQAAKPPDPDRTPSVAPAAPERDPAAELAAALPMDLSGLPPSFRAVLTGGGQLPSDEYKGVVFGRLGRSTGAIAEARTRHLRGGVLVSFSVADDGQVVDLKVGHSSGIPAVDALALQMVREAAPFPPPPPNSQRSFTPVLSFGENE